MKILPLTPTNDRDSYHDSANEYIPIVCHCDEHTLITKNGQLIQTIKINGIAKQQFSQKIFELRQLIRQALEQNIPNRSFAFWIHTIRNKQNLDNNSHYDKLFSSTVHQIWCNKNYWQDKFVNTLYISIVYNAPDFKIINFKYFIESLLPNKVFKAYQEYFAKSTEQLNTISNNILSSLTECQALKLGIKQENNNYISELASFYHKLICLDNKKVLLPVTDLSNTLGSHLYAIGSDKIEVVSGRSQKYASMIALREYQNTSDKAIDFILQLPLELIATEVIYYTCKNDLVKIFAGQNEILEASGDAKLASMKSINLQEKKSNPNSHYYCYQQINFCVISDVLDELDKNLSTLSTKLANYGIVHIKEDLKLEQAFWAQLPGNFQFLRRVSPNTTNHIASIASVHNFPAGNPYNKYWGEAITLLRTEVGTPFFFNFHTDDGKTTNCIIGNQGSGKTILTNFLLSEATKFNPTILYFSHNNQSQILLEALEGKWVNIPASLFNPLLTDNIPDATNIISNFMQIALGHYTEPLNDDAIKFLEDFVKHLLTLEPAQRNLQNLLVNSDFTTSGGEIIKTRLSKLVNDEVFNSLYNNTNKLTISQASIIGYNLNSLFSKEHKDLQTATIYFLTQYLYQSIPGAKIIVFDNIESLIDIERYESTIGNILNSAAQYNTVIVSSINLSSFNQQKVINSTQSWLQYFATKIILPFNNTSDNMVSQYELGNIINNIEQILSLNKQEKNKLLSLNLQSRLFLLKNINNNIVLELSISNLTGILRILCANNTELEIYKQILLKKPGHPDNWLNDLYQQLDDVSD